VVPKEKLSYILGNPPFVGKKEQKPSQKADMALIFKGVRGAGVLDFVSAWYVIAAKHVHGSNARCAFVSTNSVTQGEQVGVLWGELYRIGVRIHFAHRTFKWSNEARGKAAVHCVIIGFGHEESEERRLFVYDSYEGEPHEVPAARINAYLADAPEVLLHRRERPICSAPAISKGSEATDFGLLFLDPQERESLLSVCWDAGKVLRRAYGSDELINGLERWCIWLVGVSPDELRKLPPVVARVERVRDLRLQSGKARTRDWAAQPALFSEIRQPSARYLAIPKVSSERRKFLPMSFLGPDDIATGSLQVIPEASAFDFAVLSSSMHMAWMRYTCGRMKSDYQYSNSIVYNNFPWPDPADQKAHSAIEAAAKEVVDARSSFPGSTLADLYDPLTMPPALVKAHQQLDKAVDAAYVAAEKAAGRKAPKLGTDAERVAFLFERYQALTSLLPVTNTKKARSSRKVLARRDARA
jgi:hypothetical protein